MRRPKIALSELHRAINMIERLPDEISILVLAHCKVAELGRAAQDRLLERPPHAVSAIEVAPRPGRASQLGHLAVREDQDADFAGESLDHVDGSVKL